MSATQPKVAVVHDWLLDFAGSERVLREILAVLPGADLFALVDLPDDELKAAIPRRAKATTFVQSLPSPRRWLRYYVPLMPLAIEQLDVTAYDIVVSSSHAVAKGVITAPHQLHVSYVHTPMRYAWDLQHEYLRAAGLERGPLSWLARLALNRLRLWDARTANGVDVFLANSSHVAGRIRKAYRRDAEILHPPVDVAAFPLKTSSDDYYITVSRLEGYKRVDLLVRAFARMPERRLVVVGDGPQMTRLRAEASPNVVLCGRLADSEVRERLQRARAFLHAGIEDFGITMVEAQACGTPLIAFGRGGALDIVRGELDERPTGILFEEQTTEAVLAAVQRFEQLSDRITPEQCRDNAHRFGASRFRTRFAEILQASWTDVSRPDARFTMHDGDR